MTEQVKVPEIRFAGFTDPWEQRELVDIAEIVGIHRQWQFELLGRWISIGVCPS